MKSSITSGGGRAVGRTLVQIVHHHGRWAAVLVWGPAALKLIDRDEWIGWTPRQRAERIGLVVQNRRFLVLAETRMPNLASRAMGLALRQLPGQWREKHGYAPLFAETFTDIESFEGTCYKASNWQPCGLTKGFARDNGSHRADFYREHKRPKKLWLKTLSRNTRVILTGSDLQIAERALLLKAAQIESLRETLCKVPDPRAGNRSWPISSVLTLVCMGLLAGRTSLASIQRYAQFLTRKQRAWLGCPKKPKGRPGRRAPSYTALSHLLKRLDPNDLADALNARVAKAFETGAGTINLHVSSLVPQAAGRFARLIRGHWGGCEIRNHWGARHFVPGRRAALQGPSPSPRSRFR